MKVNELRIGNRLSYEGSDCIVLAVASHVFDWDLELGYFPDSIGFQRKIEDVKPIPLTEEWLFKFGFCKTKRASFVFGGALKLRYNGSGNSFAVFIFRKQVLSITHVHQLQNIYFVLSGKELTIND